MHLAASPRPPAIAPVLLELLGAPLLTSTWVQRLGRVSFLGTLDLHPRSRRAASRLEHSLGVAELGLRAAQDLGLARPELRLFVAACLLHDIGHYPLSHAAEPGFARALGVAHHGVSEWIVCGNGAIAESASLRPVLQQSGLDPDLVWGIISGRAPGPLGALSSLLLAPINVDTLDGIVRTARAFRRPGLRLPARIFLRDGDGVALAPEAIPALDRFWTLKDRMYGEVINLPSNIVCEAELSRAVADAFDRDVFDRFAEFDDDALRPLAAEHADHSGLSGGHDERFQFTRAPIADDAVLRVRKRYFVDADVRPDEGGLRRADWGRRYRHRRQIVFVSARSAATQLALPGLFEGQELGDMPMWTALPPGAEGPEI